MAERRTRREGLAFEGDVRLVIIGELNKGDMLPKSPLEFFNPLRSMVQRTSLTDIPGVKIIYTVNAFIPDDSKTCRVEAKKWEAISKKLDGITVVGISKEHHQAIAAFAQREGITHQLLSAKNGPIAQELAAELEGPGNWPDMLLREVIVADENNIVVYKGEVSNQEDEPPYDPPVEAATTALRTSAAS